MPQRLKLVVAYDGSPFAGWQSQTGGNTVQDYLERAFEGITGTKARIHGAGRTDAGVHALAQCAHIDVAENSLLAERWPFALNAALPPAIRVLRCRKVPETFHARFSAKGKVYRYRIWNDSFLPPLEVGRTWHVPAAMDRDQLMAAAKAFNGRHDFAAFAANRGRPEQNTVRTIEAVEVRTAGKRIEVDFSGDGFLYKMVRLMVGMIVRCGSGRAHPDEIAKRLADAAHAPTEQRFAAPAAGLFLVRVRY